MPPRAPAIIKQGDLTRTLKAARAAGIKIGSFEVDHVSGKVVIRADADEKAAGTSYDRWKAGGRGQG